jgi:exopolysaccharide production protein ExoZ
MLYFADFGACGVHIFFVISGFIMVYTSFAKQTRNFDSTNFLLRRFVRIYPTYWIIAAFYLLSHQLLLPYYGLSAGTVAGSLLLLPGYSSLIIGPGWTLSYEVYFYLCFGVFMCLGLLRGLLGLSLYFLLFILLGVGFHFSSAALHVVTDSLLVEFLFGAWIAYSFISDVRLSDNVSIGLLILAVVVFVAGVVVGYHSLPTVVTWGIPSALLIAGSVSMERNGSLPRIIQRCSFLGDSSYSLYLVHILIIDLLLSLVIRLLAQPHVNYFIACLVLTTFCIGAAHVFYEFIERGLVRSLQSAVRNVSKAKMREQART